MSGKYDSIINLTRPQYIDLPPMPIEDRAAQFSPFAALVGYGDAVEETARLTDDRIILSEDEAYELNLGITRLRDTLEEALTVKVVFFVPDSRKAGGRYSEKVGVVRRIDEYENVLIFVDGEKIYIDDMVKIEFVGA